MKDEEGKDDVYVGILTSGFHCHIIELGGDTTCQIHRVASDTEWGKRSSNSLTVSLEGALKGGARRGSKAKIWRKFY